MTVALLVAVIAGSQLMSKAEYLSDIPDRLVHVEQGWGELGFDVCAHAPGQMPLKLQIGSKVFTKGLGNHAPGRIVVDLEGRYTGFDAEVGVEKQDSTEGSVVFSVLVDGKKRFDSGVMRQTSDPKPVHVPLFGAQELELVAGDAGDGIICDCANWLDARLTLSSKAVPTRRSPFDVAPFGQVTTWNPQRKKGTEASRIGEFPADEVFLDHPMTQLKGGGYRLPSNGCIGLLWLERRKPKSLQLAFEGASPDLAGIHVEAWAGTAPFQGDWKPLPGHLVAGKRTLTYAVEAGVGPDFLDGFRKVRWILVPRSKTPIRVTKLGATVDCRTKNVSVVLEARANTHGLTTVRPFSCSLNGGESVEWSMDRVTRIDVSYPAGPGLTDGPGQPALRLAMPNGGTTIRLADILRGEGVYLRDVGVLVHSLKSGKTILEVEKSVEQKRTVLERVRQMPDQTLKRAMDRTYREVHFGSPTLLSLGENNWKWLVGSDGSVVWLPAPEPPEVQLPFENRRCSMAVRYNGMILNPAKRLHLPAKMERWMPVRELVGDRGLKLTTFVAPAKENKSVFLAEIEAPDSLDGNLDLSFLSDRNRNAEAKVVLDGGLAWVIDGDRLLARIDLSDAGSSPVIDQGRTSIKLKAGGHVRVLIPGWVANVGDSAFADTDSKGLATGFVAYWRHWDSQGMQFSIPDPFLSDLIRSSMVRCQVDARAQGNRIAPWIAEIHYGPLESEANTIIRGMGLMGKQEFVERSLDYFIHLYNPAGYLTTGYTVVGTGWHLWTLGEAFALFRDETWLKGHADEVARVCRWVMAQRRKTMKLDASGNRPPQYGLMTPGVIADWNAYQYYFYSNGTYCAGLEAAGRALKQLGRGDGDVFLREARSYRNDIVRAYRWAQALTPATALQNGAWVAGQPSQVHCPGPLSEFYAGEDGSRSWCYDVEVGAHNLIQQGILPADGADSREIADYLEDVMFLKDGWGDYPAAESQKDWFDLGGFAKVQPYYGRLTEVYAMRDDVKPFIRSYFNMIASLVDPSNLTIWEHFDHMGAPDKTHETGVFLQQSRFMLLKERGDQLWLAPFVTSNWMKDGMSVEVEHAPTFFGPVGYRIVSHVAHGTIEAIVDATGIRTASSIVLRLRHPKGLPMRKVIVDGKNWRRFDSIKETVTLRPKQGVMRVQAFY